MTKAFTLVELLVSVVIFTIMLIFLFEVLQMSEKTTHTITTISSNKINKLNTQDILSKDFLYAKDIEIQKDRFGNSFVLLKSSNSYSDVSHDNIAYILTRDNELFRIESHNAINDQNINNLNSNFVHLVYNDVIGFNVSPINGVKGGYAVLIQFQNDETLLFATQMIQGIQ